ncbi:CDC27 family protein [Variovorax guangxiensis]|uniref:CDC27 family protein n=1 Tax=Variovorax guangxiensis TaxID=1775474 RepID=UPI00285E23D9|nr:CDC27 family protein [Variovorax guangxiensis]MDR6854426.1 Flp pilus assembly protein TadD [Variovorax guangxiensis]
MNAPSPPADPEIAAIVESTSQLLRSLSQRIVSDDSESEHDMPPPVPIASSKLHSVVEGLCEKGDFRNALPVAMRLSMQQPLDCRAAYLLATCLQRLNQPALALGIFGSCTQIEGDRPTPGPLFRAGECLAAMGQKEEAISALETAIDLARSDAEHAEIQGLAEQKAGALRLELQLPLST